MDRNGISSYCSLKERDMLGELTYFRDICTKSVHNVVSSGSWFSFCTRISNDQVDIMRIKNNVGKSLGSFASDVFDACEYRAGVYKYLLHEFLCYYEVPTVQKSSDTYGYKSSYDKCLITSNIHVVATWLGVSVEEAIAKYGARLFGNEDNVEDDCMYPYLKLYETKEGIRKVTVPRKDIDLSKLRSRVIPVFALKEAVDVLYRKLSTNTYDVMFMKDNGQERTINTTFDASKILSFYANNKGYVNSAFEEWYKGDFLGNTALERGYIRVFEVGSSVYDSPLRSINYARVLGYKQSEPDLTYVNIDLESVLDTFKDYLYESPNLDVAEFVGMLDLFEVGSTRLINNNSPISSVMDIEVWLDSQYTLLSTVFLRQLALFMIGNPQWFKGYTGAPKVSTSSELEPPVDFNIDEFELPIEY